MIYHLVLCSDPLSGHETICHHVKNVCGKSYVLLCVNNFIG